MYKWPGHTCRVGQNGSNAVPPVPPAAKRRGGPRTRTCLCAHAVSARSGGGVPCAPRRLPALYGFVRRPLLGDTPIVLQTDWPGADPPPACPRGVSSYLQHRAQISEPDRSNSERPDSELGRPKCHPTPSSTQLRFTKTVRRFFLFRTPPPPDDRWPSPTHARRELSYDRETGNDARQRERNPRSRRTFTPQSDTCPDAPPSEEEEKTTDLNRRNANNVAMSYGQTYKRKRPPSHR